MKKELAVLVVLAGTVVGCAKEPHGACLATDPTCAPPVNTGPVAISASAARAAEGVPITFVKEGRPVELVGWSLGDGTEVVGLAQVTHAYREEGTYTVRLTYRELTGGATEAVDTAAVVFHCPPVITRVRAGADDYAVGETVVLSVKFTDSGPDDVFTGTVDWNNDYVGTGTPASEALPDEITITKTATGGVLTAVHIYSVAGTYSPVVWVSDGDTSDRRGLTGLVVNPIVTHRARN